MRAWHGLKLIFTNNNKKNKHKSNNYAQITHIPVQNQENVLCPLDTHRVMVIKPFINLTTTSTVISQPVFNAQSTSAVISGQCSYNHTKFERHT